MERHWFKAKTYGWGWTPATWQGWVVMVVYVCIVAGAAIVFVKPKFGIYGWIGYVLSIVTASGLLILVCYRTGEEPRWQWGEKKGQ